MNHTTLKALSKGRTGKLLLDLMTEIKDKVADIRTPLSIKPEIQNEVRLGIVECLDLFVVEPLKTINQDLDVPDPDEHL